MTRTNTGTEIKINVHFDKICRYSMSDVDFSCQFYVQRKFVVEISKDKMIKVDDDNYVAVFDTSLIGPGEIKLRVTAYIPDDDCDDGFRTEIGTIDTGIITYS